MALIKCMECGNDISDTAQTCPKCGVQTEFTKSIKEKKHTLIKFVFVIFSVLIILLAIRWYHINKQNEEYYRNGGLTPQEAKEKMDRLIRDMDYAIKKSEDAKNGLSN